MNIRRYKLIISAALIALSVYVFYTSTTYPEADAAQGFGAGIYPQILAVILLILTVLLIIDALSPKSENTEKVPGLDWNSVKYPAVLFGSMLFFSISMTTIGFLLDAFIFMIIVARFIFRAKWRTTLISAVLTPAVIWFVFSVAMKVPLPNGAIWRNLGLF